MTILPTALPRNGIGHVANPGSMPRREREVFPGGLVRELKLYLLFTVSLPDLLGGVMVKVGQAT